MSGTWIVSSRANHRVISSKRILDLKRGFGNLEICENGNLYFFRYLLSFNIIASSPNSSSGKTFVISFKIVPIKRKIDGKIRDILRDRLGRGTRFDHRLGHRDWVTAIRPRFGHRDWVTAIGPPIGSRGCFKWTFFSKLTEDYTSL